MDIDLSMLSAEDFFVLLNQKIVVRFSDEIKLPAELVEVKELPRYPDINRRPFSIALKTEQQTGYYPQAIYIVEHPMKGDLPIFFVPIECDGTGMKYEAIFY